MIFKLTSTIVSTALILSQLSFQNACAFTPSISRISSLCCSSSSSINLSSTTATATDAWFPVEDKLTAAPSNDDDKTSSSNLSIEQLKAQILQLGAALDRGQAYNPTSGAYYSGTMLVARKKIEELVSRAAGSALSMPQAISDMDGEWELVLTTVPHGIFRSSPFFLAVQESFQYGESKEAFGEPKANLFFKLHELQTCSWGASKVGRVAQRIDSKSNYIYSEFDTSIFSLTVIPILGWFKLLPTFGGCVVTASKITDYNAESGKMSMEVDYTTSRQVPGLSGLGKWIWDVKVPVGFIWKILPWNKGRPAACSIDVKYLDDDFRIVQDIDGELFVYTRPVVPRDLGVIENQNSDEEK